MSVTHDIRGIKPNSLFYLENYNHSEIENKELRFEIEVAKNLIKTVKKTKEITPQIIKRLVEINENLIWFLVHKELEPKGRIKLEKEIFGFSKLVFGGEYSEIYQCLAYLFEKTYPKFFNEFFHFGFPFGEKIKIQDGSYEIRRIKPSEESEDVGYLVRISLGETIQQILPEMEILLKELKTVSLEKIKNKIEENKGFKSRLADLIFSEEDAFEVLKNPLAYNFIKETHNYLKEISKDDLIIWMYG